MLREDGRPGSSGTVRGPSRTPEGRWTAALVAAAGRGERAGAADHKAFLPLGGKPLAAWSLEALRQCPEISEIVLVVAPEDVERARRGLIRVGGAQSERVVAGGEARQASVRAGLAEVSPDCDLVLVHDAARPFLRPDLVRRCMEAAATHEAVVAALPATDTVKEVGPDGSVSATLDRSRLWLVQTPQVFRYRLLLNAHESGARGSAGTDDAALVERLGHQVHVVPGDPENTKITWPEDMHRAERRLVGSAAGLSQGVDKRGGAATRSRIPVERERQVRGGIGYDAHRFAEGRPLVLAGVRFPGERGLGGHSDADVVCHAICDALLGAMGAGDIGRHFADSDPQYAGISSLSMLVRAAEMMRAGGFEIENVDTVVIAEAPRIAGRAEEMRRAVAEALGAEVARVNVKGKTTEGMGFTGRGEGIASQAIVLLRARHQAESR